MPAHHQRLRRLVAAAAAIAASASTSLAQLDPCGTNVIDPAAYRDAGADVHIDASRLLYDASQDLYTTTLTLTNVSDQTLPGELRLVLAGLDISVDVLGCGARTLDELDPVLFDSSAPSGQFAAGQTITIDLALSNPTDAPLDFTPLVLVGDPSPIAQLGIVADRLAGSTGQPFDLQVFEPNPDLQYRWNVESLGQFDGASQSLTFPDGGLFDVEVVGLEHDGTIVARGDALITVFSGGGFDLNGDQVPLPRGDADTDDSLRLQDSLLIRQSLTGAEPRLDGESADRADFDRDGVVDTPDAELTSLALLADQDVPSALVPDHGQPGALVTLYSPALLDPDARFTFRFGDSTLQRAQRLALGSVRVVVPLDVLTPGQFTESGGPTTVELYADGTLVDQLTFDVLPIDPIDPNAPLADVENFVQASQNLRVSLRQSIDDLAASGIDQTIGYPADVFASIAPMLDALFDEAARYEADILARAQDLTPFQKRALAQLANANGLQASLSRINQASLGLIDASYVPLNRSNTDVASQQSVNLLCAVGNAQDALDDATTISSVLCLASAGITGLLIGLPFDGPLLDIVGIALTKQVCFGYTTALAAANTIASWLPKAGDDFEAEIVSQTDQDIELRFTLDIDIPLCAKSSSIAQDGAVKFAFEALALSIISANAPLNSIYLQAKRISDDEAEKVVENLASVIAQLVNAACTPQTCLGEFLQDVFNAFCNRASGADEVKIVLDPNIIGTDPTNGFSQTADTLIFNCPTDGSPAPQELNFTLQACGDSLSTSVTPPCQGGEVDVLVAIGDNGSANDDIFQAAIDGVVVLTMNAPTRRTSTTVQLAPGDYNLTMRGLAAPDGIGTYYVELSVDGSLIFSRSGSNLSAGTTFNFPFSVPAPTTP